MSLIREGIVVSTGASTARVKFEAMDGLVSHDLPVLCSRTGKDKSLTLPDIGEMVVCVFTDMSGVDGYIIGSHYNESDPAPTGASQGKTFHYTAADGAVIEYDRDSGVLTASGIKSAMIVATNDITLKAAKIILDGSVTMKGNALAEGNFHTKGKLTDDGGNSNNHSH